MKIEVINMRHGVEYPTGTELKILLENHESYVQTLKITLNKNDDESDKVIVIGDMGDVEIDGDVVSD